MRPHPRIRKTVKWGGAVVLVLLLVVWVGSGWWGTAWRGRSGAWIAAAEGRVHIGHTVQWSAGKPRLGWEVVRLVFPFRWEWDAGRTATEWWLRIPLWAPAVLTLGATALAWRLDTLARRRARVGACPKCHYDRSGLAAGDVCPECGRPPA